MEAKTDAKTRLAHLITEMESERDEYLSDVDSCDARIRRGGFALYTVADLELIRVGFQNAANSLTRYLDEARNALMLLIEEEYERKNAPREG